MKKFTLFAAALAALVAVSCSKHEKNYPSPDWEVDFCQFAIHYFVPSADLNTVVIDEMQVNGELYANNKSSAGVFKSYNGIPVQIDNSPNRFFIGYNDMVVKFFKDNNLIYDQKVGNLQNGGTYHIVVYDLEKAPAVFSAVGIAETYEPTIFLKFANFLFQNPTTKHPGTVRLQYAYQDDDNWKTADKAIKFGEATETVSIKRTDQYQSIRLRVVDQNGSVLTSGDEGTEITMDIGPSTGSNLEYFVLFLGGNLEDGQPADLFRWNSK
jgi:hypothetical protein